MKFWSKLPTVPRETFLSVGVLGVIGLGILSFNAMKDMFIDTGTDGVTQGVSSYEPDLLDGQWAFMPGVTHDDQGLRIMPTKLTIVEQDGSGGQANPPVNLFGSHLEEVTDFTMHTRLEDLKDKGIIQLYGQAPVIADEFRVERKSIRLTVSSNSLQADWWNGAGQQPAATQSFAFDQQPDQQSSVDLKLVYKAGVVTFWVDGKELGTLAAADVFADKKVWIGLDGTDSWLLSRLEARGVDGSELVQVDASQLRVSAQGDEGLQAAVAKKRSDFLIGTAAALGPLTTDPAYARTALGGTFGLFTTENALKWQFVHPKPDEYAFQEADALVALAERHQVKVHGHTLVFGEANPRWVQDLPVGDVEKTMLDHIKQVVGRYQGRMHSWDVVNEPIADYDEFERGDAELRKHKWFQAMGEAYIAKAFRAARAADPKAQLFMNEYGLEGSVGDEDTERWDAFLELIQRLLDQKVPINGVGFQAHVYAPEDRIDTRVLRSRIRILEELGLKVRISEMDVYSDEGPEVQAAQYAEVLQACVAEPGCASFTTWGISDRYNFWRDDDGSLQQGEDFLWDKAMHPIAAVTKMLEILQ
ncbi:MAG TPA: endo-1,4-beta-xylanase [Candidatus Limnocylindria bacterium]|nr:endo-1,4-beta-xylanase [Candidatus Limnocylindria bacterium]